MALVKKILKTMVLSARGTAEILGMTFFLFLIVGQTESGAWLLGAVIKNGVEKSGAMLVTASYLMMFVLGRAYRHVFDEGG